MKSVEFCYWLQGYFEIVAPDGEPAAVSLTAKQVDLVRRHLALVFKHEIDPGYSADPKVQEQLQAIHDGVKALKNKPPRPGTHGRPDSETVYRC